MIPYGRHDISDDDIADVVSVLRSDFLTQGPAVAAFEHALSSYCGVPHAVAVNSATSALHIACLALGVGSGDIVWTSAITFVASANCALYCGASVDFVDIEPGTFNLSIEALERKLRTAEVAGRLPKVVIPVHMGGQSCDMAGIRALADRYGFRIVEDGSHAIGGRYKGEPVGTCRYSDVCVFSFHPVKIITSGEGGAATTADAALAERMALLRTHGITRDPVQQLGEPDGSWYYEQIELGFNYRMTDIQAALGSSQLRRVDDFVARRHALVMNYREALTDSRVALPKEHVDAYSSYHLFVIRLSGASIAEKARAFEALKVRGVGVNLHYMPVYLQPYYRALGFTSGHCPNAETYYAEAITIPLFAAMTDAQQEHVIEAVRAVTT